MTSGDLTSSLRAPRSSRGGRANSQGSRRRGNDPYSVPSPADFCLERLARVENLHAAFKFLEREGGPGPGIDRLTYEDYSSSEIYDALRWVSKAILDKRYAPYPTRLVRIPKDEYRYRELQLHRITDRTVAKALQLALDSYWRTQLPRLGQGVPQVFAQMQRYMRATKAYVLAIDDVRDCFPSARLDDVMRCHHQRISHPDLLWLIERILRGHDGPDHLTGLDQGSPYSPVAMEALLHDCLDTVLETRYPGYPLLLRYVDNLTFVCKTERDGRQILDAVSDILAYTDLSMKGKDGAPHDIRDPEFNTRVLGLTPQWQDGGLTFRIPESGFENLRQSLHQSMNHPHPSTLIAMVVRGWIDAVGPALTKKAAPEVKDRVMLILRQEGFAGFPEREFCNLASLARKRWIELSETPSQGLKVSGSQGLRVSGS